MGGRRGQRGGMGGGGGGRNSVGHVKPDCLWDVHITWVCESQRWVWQAWYFHLVVV